VRCSDPKSCCRCTACSGRRRPPGWHILLYVLVLIPFTPAIRDIRKAKTEQPAQLVAFDGKLLAEYRWVNRAWVPLAEIAPPVV